MFLRKASNGEYYVSRTPSGSSTRVGREEKKFIGIGF